MKNLESVIKLEQNGKYKYVGFMLLTDPDVAEEKAVLGTQLLFFKSLYNDEFYFLENYNIVDVSTERPYGIFQELIGTFNSNYDIIIDSNKKYKIWDNDSEKSLAVREKEDKK